MTATKFNQYRLRTKSSEPATNRLQPAHSKKKGCRHMATDRRPCEGAADCRSYQRAAGSEKHVRQFLTLSMFRSLQAWRVRPTTVAPRSTFRFAGLAHRAWLGRTTLV